MTKAIRLSAGALAILFLSMQILAAWEYHESGSTYALASMIAALIGLAAIPIIAIAACQHGHYGAGAALSLTVICLLAYTLPATVGRSADLRERKAAAKVARKKHSDKKQAAFVAMQAECATGDGRRCKGHRSVYQTMSDSGPIELGDMGTQILAWATGLGEGTLRKLSALAVGIGYDVGICALAAVAGYRPPPPARAPGPRRPRKKKQPEPETRLGNKWLADFLAENPTAEPDEARQAYEEEVAGKPGRRISPKRFERQFREMAA